MNVMRDDYVAATDTIYMYPNIHMYTTCAHAYVHT